MQTMMIRIITKKGGCLPPFFFENGRKSDIRSMNFGFENASMAKKKQMVQKANTSTTTKLLLIQFIKSKRIILPQYKINIA